MVCIFKFLPFYPFKRQPHKMVKHALTNVHILYRREIPRKPLILWYSLVGIHGSIGQRRVSQPVYINLTSKFAK